MKKITVSEKDMMKVAAEFAESKEDVIIFEKEHVFTGKVIKVKIGKVFRIR